MTDILECETRVLGEDFDANVMLLQEIFRCDATFRARQFRMGTGNRCALFYLDGMVNTQMMNLSVVRPLMLAETVEGDPALSVLERVLFSNEVSESAKLQDVLRGILYGDSALLIEGSARALVMNTKGWRTRGVSEPKNDQINFLSAEKEFSGTIDLVRRSADAPGGKVRKAFVIPPCGIIFQHGKFRPMPGTELIRPETAADLINLFVAGGEHDFHGNFRTGPEKFTFCTDGFNEFFRGRGGDTDIGFHFQKSGVIKFFADCTPQRRPFFQIRADFLQMNAIHDQRVCPVP